METDARFSACRRYRYALWRRWAPGPQVLFILLCPARADECRDDLITRRCLAFARAWGCGGLAVANLFARCCRSSAELAGAVAEREAGLVGPDNDTWLLRLHGESQVTIAGWGNRGRLLGRSRAVRTLATGLHCLGVTRLSEPRHPLHTPLTTNYSPLGTVPQLWDPDPDGD